VLLDGDGGLDVEVILLDDVVSSVVRGVSFLESEDGGLVDEC